MTADIERLTNILKFARRRLESTVEHCSVECCCIMMIFFTMIIFTPSLFCLDYTLYVVYLNKIFKGKIFGFSNFTRKCSNILQVRWKSLQCVHREFSNELAGERIFKIGPHLPKLLSNIMPLLFWETVYIIITHYMLQQLKIDLHWSSSCCIR